MPHAIVQYGRSAYVGRFLGTGDPVSRGDAVVVQTPRGQELGVVLRVTSPGSDSPLDAAGGSVLRLATPQDRSQYEILQAQAQDLLRAIQQVALPVTFIDAEVLLDGTVAILHAVPWGPCELDPLLVQLGNQFGLVIRLLDLSRTPIVPDAASLTGCGKPGCGTEGGGGCGPGGCSSSSGGCSTSSCSRGSVKSAEELTNSFVQLRQQMESAASRTPLN